MASTVVFLRLPVRLMLHQMLLPLFQATLDSFTTATHCGILNLKPDFRIIVINNGGGNIFRILDGPSDYEQLGPFIETVHQFNVQGWANFGLGYFQATDKQKLEEMLVRFYDYSSGKAAILEIITPNILSANTLKEYFKFLNS